MTDKPEVSEERDVFEGFLRAGYRAIILEADEWRPLAQHVIAIRDTARAAGVREGLEMAAKLLDIEGGPKLTAFAAIFRASKP